MSRYTYISSLALFIIVYSERTASIYGTYIKTLWHRQNSEETRYEMNKLFISPFGGLLLFTLYKSYSCGQQNVSTRMVRNCGFVSRRPPHPPVAPCDSLRYNLSRRPNLQITCCPLQGRLSTSFHANYVMSRLLPNSTQVATKEKL